MPPHELVYQTVPALGPLELGAIYRRKHLNDRFGGNRMTGIVTSSREPVVLLFHTEEPAQQFYQDGFDEDGVYWYSGEGTVGDMQWTIANRAIRDHVADGRDVLLFERVQRKDGLWRYSHAVSYFDHTLEDRPDKNGNPRKAIIFKLLPVIEDSANYATTELPFAQNVDLNQFRESLKGSGNSGGTAKQRIQTIYHRSAQVALYARLRASGTCEACGSEAPFTTPSGIPFLEVHHIDRLADGGPDKNRSRRRDLSQLPSTLPLCVGCSRL
ncbi:HNH endonuclease [Lacipirellula limnantheis]|uniref:ScoMcrA-like SRA domain-containing protein n=1 Tax=Lacipirellula limnantheis TaxID=2528024 RepID=A0A517U2G8_9BACT|nr:HNH endonuclease signature motif containing protein [Lacipirellula limnantheis]QDT74825.1 hypothetical protein I41_40280 [Lacipirellula limnantheis]